ncbi:MAG TPA: hypothetical protein VK742_21140 [Candidatus Sulfotelmatobacter sp.]|jgi:hypothetical protein|nr:hypothetical protein [Candidatus Sulfotelmatobacter sp.]
MKPKLLLCLALVLSGCLLGLFNPQSACGYEVVTQINHANLKNYSFLKIKTARLNFTNNSAVWFTVIVIPKNKQKSEHVDKIYLGRLVISDTNGFIAGTSVQWRKFEGELPDVPKPLRAKCVVFEFVVGDKYLEKSEFKVEEFSAEEKTGEALIGGSPTEYIFNLKEFDDEK